MTDTSLYVSNDQLLEQAQLVCDILQFEFLFTKTCQNLETVLSETIDNFVSSEILSQDQVRNLGRVLLIKIFIKMKRINMNM